MKKYIVTAGIALLGVTSVHAQEIRYGIKAGLNFANLMGDDVEDNSMKIGAFGGAYANIGLTDKLYIQPEVLYSMQGVDFVTDGDEGSMTLDYLNVPLMIQYGITENIRVELGPQIGFLLNVKQEITFNVDDEDEDLTLSSDSKEYTEAIDFGLNLGGSYHMDNGLNVSLRYNLGLTSISKEGKDGNIFEIDGKHSVLSLGIGYTF